ncbi:MAG: GDSL-type esterase/lipase family protein [Vicinamibacterales bacterium]
MLIVAFGDSVTQGLTVDGEHLHDEVYHARFRRLLEGRYPQSTFSVLNAGVAGQTACGAVSLVDRDIIRHQPDLTLIALGLNDAWNGPDGLPDYVGCLSTIIERVQRETASDVVLLTPNMMNTRTHAGASRDDRGAFEASAAIQTRGIVAAYAQAVRDLAVRFDVACADVYAAWSAQADAGTDTDAWLANHMNHPTAEAHTVPAALLMELVVAWEPSAAPANHTS